MTKTQSLFVLLWAISGIGLVLYFASSKTSAFDPEGKIALRTSQQGFDLDLTQWVKTVHRDLRNKTVHFTQNDCVCNYVAEPHIESIKQLTKDKNGVNINIPLTDELTEYVPSTPAVAVFNEDEQLIYFGPYATGLFCTKSNGLVERFIINRNTINQPIATIPMDSEGCYCSV